MIMSEEQVQTTAPEQQNQPVFSIEKLYVKDLSLEVPHAPQIFLEAETPEVDMRISTESKAVEEGFYDCNLTVTVTAKLADNRVVFLNEETQSGIFRIERRFENAAGHCLPEHPVPICARGGVFHYYACGLPAGIVGAD